MVTWLSTCFPDCWFCKNLLMLRRVRLFPLFFPFHLADLWNALQVFNEPKWKMEIIVQYFQKYIAKVSGLSIFATNPNNFQIIIKGCKFMTSSMVGSFSLMFACCFQNEVLEIPLNFQVFLSVGLSPFIASFSSILQWFLNAAICTSPLKPKNEAHLYLS